MYSVVRRKASGTCNDIIRSNIYDTVSMYEDMKCLRNPAQRVNYCKTNTGTYCMYVLYNTYIIIHYIGSKATVCAVLMAGTRTVSLQKQTRKSSFLTEESHTNHALIIHCLLFKRGNSYLVVRVAHNHWITISLPYDTTTSYTTLF